MTQAVGTQVGDVTEDATAARGSSPGRLSGAARRVGSEVAKFGTVGALAFVIDVGLFNVLRAGMLSDHPLTAKTVSVVVATAFAYIANRNWTYRDRARTGYGRETALFFATNAAALLISWACLATTHYLLGLDSQLADNISGNVIAVALGTLFRFWVYRTWVFPEADPADRPVEQGTVA
jgi:putative flippase GtrA